MNTCKKHSRYNCWDSGCVQDNAGRIGMDMQGVLSMGISGINFDFDGK